MKHSISTLITTIASRTLGLIFALVDELALCLFPARADESYGHIGSRSKSSRKIRFAAVSILILAFFYFLPTLVEWLLLRKFSPWIASILFGDTVGCVFLAYKLRMKRTAWLIYATATSVEAALFGAHVVSASVLIWITDFLPTLAILLYMGIQARVIVTRTALPN